MKNVMFIGAHPDDIELGAGGALLRHIKLGDNIFILVATDGEKNSDSKLRENELMKSMEYANIPEKNVTLLHLPDTLVFENTKRLFEAIENLCHEKDIIKVYTHTDKDYHQDHVTVFKETLRAARKVPDILTYEPNSSSLSNFSPNHFVDISGFIGEKVKLLQFHKSQVVKVPLRSENVLALAKFRGSQSKKFQYAEGFEVIRTVSG